MKPFPLAAAACSFLFAIPLASGQEPTPPPSDPGAVTPAAELDEELARAKARIAELEAEVARLTAELAAREPAASPPVIPPPPTDSDPFSSPAAIRRAIESAYTSSLASSLPASGDDTAAAGFRRELERWVGGANRSFRRPVRWHVRANDSRPQGDRLLVTLSPVDPLTGDSLGDSFTVSLESRIARRWSTSSRAVPSDATWILMGTFIPEIRANPSRMARGDFDHPPLIGPGAELFWRIDVDSLMPVRRETPAP